MNGCLYWTVTGVLCFLNRGGDITVMGSDSADEIIVIVKLDASDDMVTLYVLRYKYRS